jgi:hypothetical protein
MYQPQRRSNYPRVFGAEFREDLENQRSSQTLLFATWHLASNEHALRKLQPIPKVYMHTRRRSAAAHPSPFSDKHSHRIVLGEKPMEIQGKVSWAWNLLLLMSPLKEKCKDSTRTCTEKVLD